MEKLTSVQIQVPATSANCGPGFDCLGLAVSLYNVFTYTLLPVGELELEVEGQGAGQMTASEENLAFLSFFQLWSELDNKPTGLKIHMHNNIPLARGLGSSSTAIVAGIMAANTLSGSPLGQQELVALASKLEGHPDNVAPAILGGFTISFKAEGAAHSMRLEPKKQLKLIALIPEMTLPTSKARSVLPKAVPMEDSIFSMSRAALLVAALLQGDYADLAYALEDRLHQPYRLPLIPGAKEAIMAAKEAGAYQGIISGAGSTLMAYAPQEADAEEIGQVMQAALASFGQASTYKILEIDLKGAKVL